MGKRIFPKDFLWGASTAAHQVEGGTHNQWSEWEKANAERLAKTFTKRLGWLPRFASLEATGTDPENYISGRGVEHYSRYKEDFAILKQLNMNAYRFSIEWARIEPEEGKWDEKEIEHYRRYIAELKAMSIEPVPTLWHWTMPTWFTDKGGFEKYANVRYFERFVAKMGEEFGGELQYVVTLNEPNVYTALSYVSGEWPPQRKSLILALQVYMNLVHAHHRAYKALKTMHPRLQVGIAMAMSGAKPDKRLDVLGRLIAYAAGHFWNHWFLGRIRRQQDFVGVNYYFAHYYHALWPASHPIEPKSDLGWYMEPDNIEQVLVSTWKHYKCPIMITENGLADANDTYRKWWIEETLGAMERSIAAGVDLRGYLHWSLLDNFEWAYGWWPNFGLVSVDRRTMKRTIRPSARWFGEQIKQFRG